MVPCDLYSWNWRSLPSPLLLSLGRESNLATFSCLSERSQAASSTPKWLKETRTAPFRGCTGAQQGLCHPRSGDREEHQLWLSRKVLLPLPALNPALNPALSVSVGFLAALSCPSGKRKPQTHRASSPWQKQDHTLCFFMHKKPGGHNISTTVRKVLRKANRLYTCFECGPVPFAAQDWQQLCSPLLQLGN